MPESTESYRTHTHIFQNKGILARYTADRFPDPHSYYDLTNLECRMENALSSRLGTSPITVASGASAPMADPDVHSLFRMLSSKAAGTVYRYAGANRNVYRQSGGGLGAFSLVTPAVGFSQSITSIARSGNVVTVNLANPTSATAGSLVSIYGVTGASADFNGCFTIASVSNAGATITYNQTGPNESGANGYAASSSGYLPASPFSGNRLSLLKFRPNGSSLPYAFFCDSVRMLKDSGTFSALQLTGLDPPPMPATISLLSPPFVVIDTFESLTGLVLSGGFSGLASGVSVNTTLSAAITATGFQTATPASMANIVPLMSLVIDSGASKETVMVVSTTATTFTANFASTHSSGVAVVADYAQATLTPSGGAPDPGTLAYLGSGLLGTPLDLTGTWDSQVPGQTGQSSADIFQLNAMFSDPTNIVEVRLYFDTVDGTFEKGYYWSAGTAPSDQTTNTGSDTVSTGNQAAVLAQQLSVLQISGEQAPKLNDQYLPVRSTFLQGPSQTAQVPQTSRYAPQFRNTLGMGTWATIAFPRSNFSAVGLAGQPGYDWSHVVAWQIRVILGTAAGSAITVAFSNLLLIDGVLPSSIGGVGYDYRITRYNANTMAEGNPSPTIEAPYWLYPFSNPILVQINDPLVDAQVTHWRIYRRGGALGDNWRYIDQIPVAGGPTYQDNNPDFAIEAADLLEIDNDPPVTSNLQNPVSTTLSSAISSTGTQLATPASMANIAVGQQVTVDQNEYQETVIVQAVYAASFAAYFQYTHPSGAQVTASTYPRRGLNLSALSQGRGWYAGDSANPHFLYYSKPNQVEAVPPENYVEVGTPADPIMAVVDFRGQTYVFTKTTAYQMVFFTSGIPTPLPTACRHGLAGSFAWTKTEGAIFYLSYDGMYEFAGGGSAYMSEPVEWIFFGTNYGPIPQRDKSKDSDAVVDFYNNEVYLAYTDVNGTRRRIIYSLVYKRWRPDDVPAFSMLFEEDANTFLFGSSSNGWETPGMVYQDRTGDSDITGYAGGKATTRPMPVSVRTVSLDQGVPKQDKIYNETTFDVDTSGNTQAGQVLQAVGWFDETQVSFPLGAIQSIGRHQQQVNVNEGIGQLSRTCSLQITGNITRAVHFYQCDFRFALDAEPRQSYDTYFLDMGIPEFKTIKQLFAEYQAPDPAGISFNVYLDGSGSPAFAFTLPQSQARTAVRIRFPAWKARLWRFIATSPSDFKMYSTSHYQWKICGSVGGYRAERFKEPV